MSRLPMLSREQMKVLQPLLPHARGLRRVEDRRVISGIIYVIRNGLQWKDAPGGFGSHKTFCNRFIRRSERGVFEKIFPTLAAQASVPECLMIDNTQHLKAHRTAASLRKKGGAPRRIGRTRGNLNSKLHVVSDDVGRPIAMLLTEGR